MLQLLYFDFFILIYFYYMIIRLQFERSILYDFSLLQDLRFLFLFYFSFVSFTIRATTKISYIYSCVQNYCLFFLVSCIVRYKWFTYSLTQICSNILIEILQNINFIFIFYSGKSLGQDILPGDTHYFGQNCHLELQTSCEDIQLTREPIGPKHSRILKD